VIFCDMDTALREHSGDRCKKYWHDHPGARHKFAALNSAVVVGRFVACTFPRASSKDAASGLLPDQHENMGQFERTLIIADGGSKVH